MTSDLHTPRFLMYSPSAVFACLTASHSVSVNKINNLNTYNHLGAHLQGSSRQLLTHGEMTLHRHLGSRSKTKQCYAIYTINHGMLKEIKHHKRNWWHLNIYNYLIISSWLVTFLQHCWLLQVYYSSMQIYNSISYPIPITWCTITSYILCVLS